MLTSEPCPHPVSQQDAKALIGLLAVLEGYQRAGHLDPDLGDRLGQRLAREGLLVDARDAATLAPTLADLNQRMRRALGEYDQKSGPHGNMGA